MAEEVTVMVMEEDTAEDIGVKVTPNVHTCVLKPFFFVTKKSKETAPGDLS